MSKTKLKHAPLKEVIFELHWAGIDTLGAHSDSGFNLAQGKFQDKLKSEYPVHKQLMTEGMGIKFFGVPLH